MGWRPDNWENPHNNLELTTEQLRGVDSPAGHYEAGADAMLEALRKVGWRPEQENDQRHLSHRALRDMMTVGKFRKGAWVFIAD